MKTYPVEFEIAGPAAMFARPDTGAAPVSYPVPTWSACKAMFESVARGIFQEGKDRPQFVPAFICPTEVEIWSPIRFEKYVFNYRGPLRKQTEIDPKNGGGNSYQLSAMILVDVCYRIRGECVPIPGVQNPLASAAHALQEIFQRRLKRGFSKYAPCLGWKEFLPTYFGEFRHHSHKNIGKPEKQHDLDLLIPGLLHSMWDSPVKGVYSPVFRQVQIKNGVLKFRTPAIQNGKLVFPE